MSQLNFDIWSVLLAIGVGQGAILLVAILAGKRNGNSKYFLGTLLLIFTFSLFEYLLLNSGYYAELPHLTRITFPFLFLLGPLLYLYSRAQLAHLPSFSVVLLLHLVPFIIALSNQFQWYLMPSEQKIFILGRSLTGGPKGVNARDILLPLSQVGHVLVYLLLTLREIWKAANQSMTVTLSKRISFLKVFSNTFLIYWILQVFGLVSLVFFQLYVYQIDYVLALINSVFIQSLAIFLIIRPEAALAETREKKYVRSSLDQAQYNEILAKVSELMGKQIYLDANLTLEDFSQELKTNKNYVSQVINQEFGLKFNDYLNSFRIAKAIELIKNPSNKHIKLLGIALESGFNNKTSFTRAFRRQKGMIPSEFRSEWYAGLQEADSHGS